MSIDSPYASSEGQTDSYDAFISYRRRDGRVVASWLRDRLQRTRLPSEVLSGLSEDGRRLHERRPHIFLDTAYEKPSPDFLNNKLYPVLDRTPRLIVVSTPAAFEKVTAPNGKPDSNWLEKEIDRFLAGSNPKTPLRPIDVVLGPGAPENRFPGRLNDNPAWDWADLRGFTRRRALGLTDVLDQPVVKLLAALYDVPPRLLPLVQREEQRRRNRLLLWIGAVATLLLAVMTVLSVLAVGGQVAAKRATADALAGLLAARVELANAQALAAARYRTDGDELSATRLLSEARETAPTARVTAEVLASPRPYMVFQRNLTEASPNGAWPFAYVPADSTLALGRFDGSVTALDPKKPVEERTLLQAGGPPVIDLAATADGRRLFVLRRAPADAAWNAGPGDNEILVVSPGSTSSKPLRQAPRPGEPSFLSLATDAVGNRLLVGTDRDVRILHPAEADLELRKLPVDGSFSAAAVALSTDGRYAAASSISGDVRVWDLAPGGAMRRYQVPYPAVFPDYTTLSPRFDPTGRVLAFGSFDGWVYLWRVGEDPAPRRFIHAHAGAVTALAWSPNGNFLSSGGSDGEGTLIDIVKERVISRLPMGVSGPVASVVRLAFAPDGRGLVAGAAVPLSKGGDPAGQWLFGAVRSWAITKPATLSSPILGFGFAADGRMGVLRQEDRAIALRGDFTERTLACGSGLAWTALAEGQRSRRPVQLLQLGKSNEDLGGTVITSGPRLPGTQLLGSAAIAPDGRSLAILTGQVDQSGTAIVDIHLAICSIESGQLLYSAPISVPAASTLGPVAFERKGTRIILAVTVPSGTADDGGGVHVFAVESATARAVPLGQWRQRVAVSMAILGDGPTLALADDSGALALLDTARGTIVEVPPYFSGLPLQVVFAPDGTRLFAAGIGQLRAITVTSKGSPGEERRAAVLTGFKATSIAISPDGTVLATGDTSGRISLWDAATLTLLTQTQPRAGPVLALGIGPDGSTLVSIGPDGAELGGRFVPLATDMAERLSRLSARGAVVQPLGADRETALVQTYPNVDWPSAGDSDAAEFWRLYRERGIRRSRPAHWWQWLWWSGPYELSSGLAGWKKAHPGHPLSNALDLLARGTDDAQTKQ